VVRFQVRFDEAVFVGITLKREVHIFMAASNLDCPNGFVSVEFLV
jgi:hypothetical protein